MTNQEPDEFFRRLERRSWEVRPGLVSQIAASLGTSLTAVRPIPPPWTLSLGLVVVCVLVAVAGGLIEGFFGIKALSSTNRVAIFSTLALLTVLTSRAVVRHFIPGSRHRATAGVTAVLNSVALLGLFALLFHDYHATHFLATGIACLLRGVLFAVPAALIGALLLFRGFAVDPVAAGLALGTMGGLAGVTLLELQCTNFQAPHLLWHVLVVLVSAGIGALTGLWSRFAR